MGWMEKYVLDQFHLGIFFLLQFIFYLIILFLPLENVNGALIVVVISSSLNCILYVRGPLQFTLCILLFSIDYIQKKINNCSMISEFQLFL